MAPAAVRVRVPVARVDERVLERSADVLGRQTGHRRHHVSRELAHAQRAPVLASPPVVLRPDEQNQTPGQDVHDGNRASRRAAQAGADLPSMMVMTSLALM